MPELNLHRYFKSHKLAVLKGGWSKERSISLKTGEAVEKSLQRLKIPYTSVDVQPNLTELLRNKKIKFCFICLHGTYGEDGRVQNELDLNGIQYTGADAISSSIAMNKNSAKILMAAAGVPVAKSEIVFKSSFLSHRAEVLKKLKKFMKSQPVFVKPADQGSAIGVSKVAQFSQMASALKKCFQTSNQALVEEFISGREMTVGIIGKKALPVIEIIPEHSFYDFHSKYAQGGSKHILPAPLSKKATQKIQILALKAFEAIGTQVYGRVDFIMKKNGKMVALEINTIPGMTNLSLLPEAAKAAGLNFDKLVLTIMDLSLKKKRRRHW